MDDTKPVQDARNAVIDRHRSLESLGGFFAAPFGMQGNTQVAEILGVVRFFVDCCLKMFDGLEGTVQRQAQPPERRMHDCVQILAPGNFFIGQDRIDAAAAT